MVYITFGNYCKGITSASWCFKHWEIVVYHGVEMHCFVLLYIACIIRNYLNMYPNPKHKKIRITQRPDLKADIFFCTKRVHFSLMKTNLMKTNLIKTWEFVQTKPLVVYRYVGSRATLCSKEIYPINLSTSMDSRIRMQKLSENDGSTWGPGPALFETTFACGPGDPWVIRLDNNK